MPKERLDFRFMKRQVSGRMRRVKIYENWPPVFWFNRLKIDKLLLMEEIINHKLLRKLDFSALYDLGEKKYSMEKINF